MTGKITGDGTKLGVVGAESNEAIEGAGEIVADDPSGLDAAADAHPTVRTGDVKQSGEVGQAEHPMITAGRHRRIKTAMGATDVYVDVVSLDRVLEGLMQKPEFEGFIRGLFADITAKTGIEISEQMQKAVIADPSKIVDALAFSPDVLAMGLDAIAAAGSQLGGYQEKERKFGDTIKFEDLVTPPHRRPEYKLEQIAPGLYRGSRKSEISDEQAAKNMGLSEAFDRLAENTVLGEGQKPFGINVGDRTITKLEDFVDYLESRNYQVEISFALRIANFAELMVKPDDAPDSAAKHVPACLMVRTGEIGADGTEALLPAAHAEMIVEISGGDDDAPDISGKVKGYQGISGTGFFPAELAEVHEWLGWKETEIDGASRFTGDQAKLALRLFGLLTDVINEVSREHDLPAAGYGFLNVCQNTVQYLITALDGDPEYYPMLGNDGPMLREIYGRLADRIDDGELAEAGPSGSDQVLYQRLVELLEATPSDGGDSKTLEDPTRKLRMRRSQTHPAGREAFHAQVDARPILDA